MIWLGVVAVGWKLGWAQTQLRSWGEVSQRVGTYLVFPARTLTLSLGPGVSILPGDPIFRESPAGNVELVGEVVTCRPSVGDQPGEADLRFSSLAGSMEIGVTEIWAHQADLSGSGALQTLLPPAKRAEMALRWSEAWKERQEETLTALAPALRAAMEEVYPAVELEVEASLGRHGPELSAIIERHQRESWSPEFSALAGEVAWPIIRTKAQPVVDSMAGEIWQRVSVWRLGWHYLADKVGVPGNALEKEWSRFVAEDALPIIESRMGELADVASSTLAEISADPRVQETLRVWARRLIEDPAVQQLLGTIARESIVESPPVHAAFARAADRPEVRSAFSSILKEWEPVAVGLLQQVMADERGNISPELARVLRSHLLGKDQRWLSVRSLPAGSHGPGVIIAAQGSTGYPLPARLPEAP
jgi:hypothetical protein